MPDPVVLEEGRRANTVSMLFYCPGCREHHGFRVKGPESWEWDGSMTKPTFSPSLRVLDSVDGKAQTKCHLFVRAGKIQFLKDSLHELAGKTVDMTPVDEQ
jgi:hypothetical protein